jgi:serine/threonine-protein kinase
MGATQTMLSGVFAGRYVIEGVLGRGATAIVYLARDQERGHAVAIKVLKPELAESIGADRFLKEIRLTEGLNDPHILPVLDSGEYEGRLYFVLPHMEGGTLKMRLEREKQLPLNDAVAITRCVAAALAHAHEKGLVHRDVKPANILFTSGQACLGDFGIARALERAAGEETTSTTLARGTPPYMSPEQASGERDYDGRTDVYSLGCVTYEMLAGMQPFVGPTPESVIAQKLTQPPRPLRVYRPTVPAAVEAVVARALAATPADRYQTPLEFAEALEAAAKTVDEPSAGGVGDVRRRRVLAVIGGAAVAAVLAATAIVMRPSSSGVTDVPASDPRRIAVLYFDDLTPDKRLGHVAAGLTENLIDQLSQVPLLRVISPNGVRVFRDSVVSLDTVARRLNAGTVIAGSVSGVGAQLRVAVRMIDATSGAQLNSRVLLHPLWNFFRLQDTLTMDVAYWLREHLGRQIRLREYREGTSSVGAWELLQRGEALRDGATLLVRKDDPRAADVFRRADSTLAAAEALDPRWVMPVVYRARTAINRAFVYTDNMGRPTPPFAAQLREAIRHADRALRRSPRLAAALAARGEARARLVTLTGEQPPESLLALAESDLQLAAAERPDVARTWYALGEARFHQGKFSDAAEAFKTAYDADPFLENVRLVVHFLLFSSLYANRFDEARQWCRLGISRFADDLRFTDCGLYVLGGSGKTAADVASAWRILRDVERGDSTGYSEATWSTRRMMVAAVLARAGMHDSARAVLARTAHDRGDKPAADRLEAYVRLLLGDRDAALGLLAKVLAQAPNDRAWVARFPWYQELREDPRFKALVSDR